jgi:hypothetical protein
MSTKADKLGEVVKHTRGPWDFSEKLSGSENHKGFHLFAPKERDGKGLWIGEISPVSEENGDASKEGWANARLIAAAPDLLEALEATLSEFDSISRNTHPGRPYGEGVTFSNQTREQVRAAIRFAKGESL